MESARRSRRASQLRKQTVHASRGVAHPILALYPLPDLTARPEPAARKLIRQLPFPVIAQKTRLAKALHPVRANLPQSSGPCTMPPTSGAFDSGSPLTMARRTSVVPSTGATGRAIAYDASCPVRLGILSSEPRLCPPGSSPHGTVNLSSAALQLDESGKSIYEASDHCRLLYGYLIIGGPRIPDGSVYLTNRFVQVWRE